MGTSKHLQKIRARQWAVIAVALGVGVMVFSRLAAGSLAQPSAATSPGPVNIVGTYDFTAHFVDAVRRGTGTGRKSDFGDYQVSRGTLVVVDQVDRLFRGRLIWRERTELITGALINDPSRAHTNRLSINLKSLTMNGHVRVEPRGVTIEGIGGGWNAGKERDNKTVAFWSIDFKAEKVSD